MRIMWLALKGLSMLCLSFVFCGCMAFPRNCGPRIDELPSPKEAKALNVRFHQDWTMDMNGQEGSALPEDLWLYGVGNVFINVLRESNFFTSAYPAEEGARCDIYIETKMCWRPAQTEAAPALILAGLTMFCVPTTYSTDWTLTAKAQTAQGERTYVLKDGLRYVPWWPLVFAAPFKVIVPFKSDWVPTAELHRNMYKALLVKIKEDGLLDHHPGDHVIRCHVGSDSLSPEDEP